MPVAFTTWTVLPHTAIDKLSANLWRVEGTMPDGSTRRILSAVRLADGRILLHNAIALEEPLMAELDAWGEVAGILVPNGFHRQDARIMKDRYPKARVYGPAGAAKAIAKAVPVDGTYADAPGDPTVTVRHLQGNKEREGVVTVRHPDGQATAIFCDTVLNQRRLGFPIGVFLHPTGRPSVPRVVRWMMVADAGALRADLEAIANIDGLARVIPGHGRDLTDDAPAQLRHAADVLT